jgi:hypothetical protein
VRSLRLLSAAAAVLALAGCEPVYEGPQLAEVPDGLAYTTSLRTSRVPLPGRQLVAQYGYAAPGGTDWRTSVTISEFAGLATRGEVEAARQDDLARYGGRSSRYGAVEEMRVDGRPAWAYTVDALSGGEVTRHGLTAVVPWDDRTFGIEVSSEEEKWMDRAVQKRLAASFHVARKGRYRPLLFAVFAAAGAGWLLVEWRRKRQ